MGYKNWNNNFNFTETGFHHGLGNKSKIKSDAYSEPSRISKAELFVMIVNEKS